MKVLNLSRAHWRSLLYYYSYIMYSVAMRDFTLGTLYALLPSSPPFPSRYFSIYVKGNTFIQHFVKTLRFAEEKRVKEPL